MGDNHKINYNRRKNDMPSQSSGSRSRESRASPTGTLSRTSIGSGSRSDGSRLAGAKEVQAREEPFPQEKGVRFSEIQIRDYERVVGDNPSCSSGPPIA